MATLGPQATGQEILIVLLSLLRGRPGRLLTVGENLEAEPAGKQEEPEDIGQHECWQRGQQAVGERIESEHGETADGHPRCLCSEGAEELGG